MPEAAPVICLETPVESTHQELAAFVFNGTEATQADVVEPQKPVPPEDARAAVTALFITVVLGVEVANKEFAVGAVQEEAFAAVP